MEIELSNQELEKHDLLEAPQPNKKKSLKKLKFLGLLNFMILFYCGYSALSSDLSKNLEVNPVYTHLKASMNIHDMAPFHTQVMHLIETGLLEQFNGLSKIVDDSKKKSEEVGAKIKSATDVSTSIKKLVDSFSNPSSIVSGIKGIFGLNQKGMVVHDGAHAFSFDIKGIMDSITNAKNTHTMVRRVEPRLILRLTEN